MEKTRNYSLKIKVNKIDENEYEYIARYDQFPTIVGVGDTPEEALNEAKIFLEEYLAYCEKEEIKINCTESSDWLEDYSGKITIRIPRSLHRDLSNYAENDGMSINSIVNDAIRSYLTGSCMEKNANAILSMVSDQISELNSWKSDNLISDYKFPTKNVYLN